MSQEWIAAAGRIALDSSLRILAVAIGVAAILALLRVRSSVVRHKAWTVVVCAMFLMPVLRYCVPSITVPVPIPMSSVRASIPVPELVLSPGGVSFSAPGTTTTSPVSHTSAVTVPLVYQWTSWPMAVIAIYFIVAGALMLRLLLGWRTVTGIVRRSRGIDAAEIGDPRVRESDVVSAPFVVGVYDPGVILPAGWRYWPGENLRAVLAHELAHVRRRDPLVGVLARLNRSIFWFHALAWWLERELAATAEHACDAAGVEAAASPQKYSEILLDLSKVVRQNKGRLLHGMGIDGNGGNGNLSDRIDRVLRGDFKRRISPIRKAILVLACSAAIVFPVACRQQPAPLQPDPTLRVWTPDASRETARKMTLAQIAEVETSFNKNPEDLVALKTILAFYAPDFSGNAVPNLDKIVAARRKYILWLIAHHPDSELAGSFDALIFPTTQDPLPDPVGYQQAKKLWLAETSKPGVSTIALSNAANFFEAYDKQLAEQMLLRAAGQQPDRKWSYRLGTLYALTLLGPMNAIRSVSLKDAEDPYAQEVRKKLEASTDAVLLASAAENLMFNQRPPVNTGLGFDPDALAKTCVARALQLAPKDRAVLHGLFYIQFMDRQKRATAALAGIPEESQYAAVSAMPERVRFDILPELAEFACLNNQADDYYRHNQVKAKAAWDRSRKYAQDLLTLAPKFQTDPEYPAALYRANIALGTVAMRNGDKKSAVQYMVEASKAPLSESSFTGFLRDSLITSLLKYGERESVAAFLEQRADRSSIEERARLLHSASQIRSGIMPEFYQRANS